MLAAPRKKLPERRVTVLCNKCGQRLYRYAKGNGAGSQLVKVYLERIVEDYTDGQLSCPSCGTEFARPATIHGRPANKIISGKVKMK